MRLFVGSILLATALTAPIVVQDSTVESTTPLPTTGVPYATLSTEDRRFLFGIVALLEYRGVPDEAIFELFAPSFSPEQWTDKWGSGNFEIALGLQEEILRGILNAFEVPITPENKRMYNVVLAAFDSKRLVNVADGESLSPEENSKLKAIRNSVVAEAVEKIEDEEDKKQKEGLNLSDEDSLAFEMTAKLLVHRLVPEAAIKDLFFGNGSLKEWVEKWGTANYAAVLDLQQETLKAMLDNAESERMKHIVGVLLAMGNEINNEKTANGYHSTLSEDEKKEIKQLRNIVIAKAVLKMQEEEMRKEGSVAE